MGTRRRRVAQGLVALGVVLPVSGGALGTEAGGAIGSEPPDVVEPHETVHVVDDDAIGISSTDERTDRSSGAVQPLPATDGFAIIGGVTGYARTSYVIRLAATPDVERLRPSAELAARVISAETGLSVTVAAGQIEDRAPADGEVVMRVTRDSPCGSLSSPGRAGCGGPRTLGTLITRGDVWIAPETGCDGRGVSTIVHELGHVFGLGHYTAPYQGLLQLMYPDSSSDAPSFRAGDRAGLRALANRTAAFVTEPQPAVGELVPVAPRSDTVTRARITAAPSAATYFSQPPLVRVLDTRNGIGLAGAFVPDAPRTLDLGTYLGSSATAVALNLTATGAATDGFVTASPSGTPPPNTSNANYVGGKDTANLVIVRLGPGSKLDLRTGNLDRSAGPVHLLADLLGVFTADGADGFVTSSPTRVYDTRASSVPGERGFPLGCAEVDAFDQSRLVGVGMPSGTSAAVVNLTAADANGDGFVSLLDPADGLPGAAEPATSNINVSHGATRANLAITPGRSFYLRTSNALVGDVIIDVAGYFVDRHEASTSAFVAVDPTRVLDTRVGLGLSGRFAPETTRSLPVPIAAGIDPAKVAAVAINMTVAEAQAAGYLTVAPSGEPLPVASNVNYGAGGAVPNLAVVKVGTGRSIDIMAFAGSPHVIGDVMGYFVRP